MPYADAWLVSAITSLGLVAIGILLFNAIESSLNLYGSFSKIITGFFLGIYSTMFVLTGMSITDVESIRFYDFRFLLIAYVGAFFGVTGLLSFSVVYLIAIFIVKSSLLLHSAALVFALVVSAFSSKQSIKMGIILLMCIPLMAYEPILRGIPNILVAMPALVVGSGVLMLIATLILLSSYLNSIYIPFLNKITTYISVALRHYDDICHFNIDFSNDQIRISKSFFNMFELPDPMSNTMSYKRFEELLRNKLLIGIPPQTSVRSVFESGTSRVVLITAQTHSGKLIQITSRVGFWGRIKGVILDVTYSVNHEVIVNVALRTDYTTGMKTFYGMKDEMLQEAKDYNGEAVQIHMAIESMEHYTSLYGVEFREAMVKIVASKLREVFKRAKIYYFSNGKFHIVFFAVQGKVELIPLQRHLENILVNPSLIKGHRLKFKISSGINITPASRLANADDLDKSILETMWAQETAHTLRRDEPYYFDQNEYALAQQSVKRYEAIPEIIANRQFEIVYQPIVDVTTGLPFAYEALTRVKSTECKNVHQLIVDSIELGLAVDLDTCLLSCIYQDLSKINIKANLFINKLPETPFIEEIKNLQRHIQINGFDMFLELTEYDRYELNQLKKMLKEFMTGNIHVVLDDYGSGYSSPIFLANISPEIVKIDMDLIRDIEISYNKELLVQGLIDYCKRIGIKCVAEGISSKSELAKVISMGVDYVQGFYVCYPERDMPDVRKEIVEEIKFMHSNLIV